MHQYLENVRNEIENQAGQEAYLASVLFLKMYKSFHYEDEGAFKLIDKKGFEEIQNKAINSLNTNQKFNLKDEILAWQAAILRDISKEFYSWWIDYKDEKFRAPDCFSDGESCMALEACCEKINENPTEVYTRLLEVELTLTRLHTSCNKTLIEIDKFWQFKYNNKKKDAQNMFIQKRISSESKSTIIFESIDNLQTLSNDCLTFAKQLAGKDYLLWINPHIMLESLIQSLNGFLNFEYIEDADLSLTNWLETLFPVHLKDKQPNPMFESGLHHQIIANLSQATQCLVQHTVKRTDAFAKRDMILKGYLVEHLEKIKIMSLKNINENLNKDVKEHSTQK